MEKVKVNNPFRWIQFPRLCKLLKQAAKFMICLVLCCALVFGYSYKKPVEVHATAVAVVGSVVVSACLAALGITIGASVGNDVCKEIYDSIWTNGAAALWDNGCYAVGQAINVTPAILQYVGNQFLDIIDDGDAVAAQLVGSLPNGTIDYVNPIVNYDFIKSMFGLQTFVCDASIDYDFVSKTHTNVSTVNGLWVVGTFLESSSNQNLNMRFNTNVLIGKVSGSGGASYFDITVNEELSGFSGHRFSYYPIENKSGLNYRLLVIYQIGTKKNYAIVSPSEYAAEVFKPLNEGNVYFGGDQSYLLDKTKIKHNGAAIGVNDNTPTTVADKLADKVGVTEADGSKTIPLVNTGSQTDLDSKNRTQTQAETTNADIATAADEAANEEADVGHDDTVPKPADMPDVSLPKLITKKFPFSLPWDLYGAFKNLVSPPQPPKWDIPFKIQSLNFEKDITIDFSQFSTLASILRWGLSVTFIIWLILLTRKIIGGG